MEPDCENAVFGYGDANADFHVIGDHPGIHGGIETGIPFTGALTGKRVQRVLAAVGLLDLGDDPGTVTARNCFLSYLHMCPPAGSDDNDASTDGDVAAGDGDHDGPQTGSGTPSAESYANLERFFDAELRAIAAHVLVPVGARAIRRVLDQYTAQGSRYESAAELEALHAEELHGSGFLVLPMKDPGDWIEDDEQAIVTALETTLERDYRQLSDLGRFLATDEPYLVR